MEEGLLAAAPVFQNPAGAEVTTMGWADIYIGQLHSGKTISFRPKGNSMTPRIESGQLCTVEPVTKISPLTIGDIVLCRVDGRQFLHLIKAIQNDERFQIANNKNYVNGWVTRRQIFGKLINIEP
jgi:SOS-response transcriptional repressor LexA